MTELDHTVLSIIARDGPMSAYDVRKVFANSLTPSWSSSAGSIYPSIKRLVARNFIAQSAPQGGRETRALSVTAAGRAALVDWLLDDCAAISGATADPIRTRCYFLQLLSEAQRIRFLADALASTNAAIEIAERARERRHADRSDRLQELVSEGVLYQLRARRDWLQMLARYFDTPAR